MTDFAVLVIGGLRVRGDGRNHCRNDGLAAPPEDGDVAETFTDIAADRHDVYTRVPRNGREETDGEHLVHAEIGAVNELTVEGSEVLVALGRRPNSGTLGLDAAGIDLDDDGFIKTNEYLETAAENSGQRGTSPGVLCSNTRETMGPRRCVASR